MDELAKRAYEILVRELGESDTLRFLQSISSHLDLSAFRGLSDGGRSSAPSTITSPGPEEPQDGTSTLALVPRPPLEGPAEKQFSLFPSPERTTEMVQPWEVGPAEPKDEERACQRRDLLARLGNSNLATIEAKVADVLQRFPETRDNDTALALRFWTSFEAAELESIDPASLDVLYSLQNSETIVRSRRHIQNELGLFEGRDRTRQLRSQLQMQFYQMMSERRSDDPEVRLYLDETGNEPSSRFTGVAGICVMSWRFYEIHHAALEQWRERQAWPETIHFADLRDGTIDRALLLLAQLRRRRRGLLFLGHSVPSRGLTHPFLMDLFIQLTCDCIGKIRDLGCLNKPTAITVIKEAEEGFDCMYVPAIRAELERRFAREFPNRAYLRKIEPLPKGREVLLECADLIASSMQRKALFGGFNPKDKLAEAVFNVTGFGDHRESGVVFRSFTRL